MAVNTMNSICVGDAEIKKNHRKKKDSIALHEFRITRHLPELENYDYLGTEHMRHVLAHLSCYQDTQQYYVPRGRNENYTLKVTKYIFGATETS